jgi:hypothetical protein
LLALHDACQLVYNGMKVIHLVAERAYLLRQEAALGAPGGCRRLISGIISARERLV